MSTCPSCGWWDKVCHCGGTPGDKVMLFTPHVYEDLDIHPIEITSKRQLKRECERRGLWAERLQ